MTKDDLLKEAAKHHKEWISVIKAHSFNKTESAYAEDFVQEAYIKLYNYASPERVAPKGVLNKGYVFFTLKSVLFDYRRAKKTTKIYLEDCETCEQQEQVKGQHHSPEDLLRKMYEVTKDWNWYDKKLFEIYTKEVPSIRKLAEQTNISTNSIYYTLKKAKNEITKKLQEEYQTYQEASN